MANELKHITVGTDLAQVEWEGVATHTVDGGEQGDKSYEVYTKTI